MTSEDDRPLVCEAVFVAKEISNFVSTKAEAWLDGGLFRYKQRIESV